MYCSQKEKCRLQAASLFLLSPWERTQNKYACKLDYECDVGAVWHGSSMGIGGRSSHSQSHSLAYLFCVLSHGFLRKRETARSLRKMLKYPQCKFTFKACFYWDFSLPTLIYIKCSTLKTILSNYSVAILNFANI